MSQKKVDENIRSTRRSLIAYHFRIPTITKLERLCDIVYHTIHTLAFAAATCVRVFTLASVNYFQFSVRTSAAILMRHSVGTHFAPCSHLSADVNVSSARMQGSKHAHRARDGRHLHISLDSPPSSSAEVPRPHNTQRHRGVDAEARSKEVTLRLERRRLLSN